MMVRLARQAWTGKYKGAYVFNEDGTKAGYVMRRSYDRKRWVIELDGNVIGTFATGWVVADLAKYLFND